MADVKNWIREAMFYHIYPLDLPERLFVTKGKQRQADGF